MHIADCQVRIGGDVGNTVVKQDVTIAEIALLRAIHGQDSVVDIAPKSNDRRAHRDELQRLRARYGFVAANLEKLQTIWSEFGAGFPKDWGDLDLTDAFFARDASLMPEKTEEQKDRQAGRNLKDSMAVEADVVEAVADKLEKQAS